jgi:hypothetical protein
MLGVSVKISLNYHLTIIVKRFYIIEVNRTGKLMNIWAIYKLLETNGVDVRHKASKSTTSDGSVRYSLIKVQDLGKFFNISNPAEYFRKIARGEREERFIEFIKQSTGRPAMYIAEPIFYEFLLTSDNPICHKLQDWVFGTVVNHLVNDGIYTKAMEKVSND